jgi:hypothetical protein
MHHIIKMKMKISEKDSSYGTPGGKGRVEVMGGHFSPPFISHLLTPPSFLSSPFPLTSPLHPLSYLGTKIQN